MVEGWIDKFNLLAGFDLSFEKWFMSFFNKDNHGKPILNTAHHGWVMNKIFHTRKKGLLKYFLKSHLKIFLLKLCRVWHTCRKGSLLLQKLHKSTLPNFYHCHM